jgi:hypothetical protein
VVVIIPKDILAMTIEQLPARAPSYIAIAGQS